MIIKKIESKIFFNKFIIILILILISILNFNFNSKIKFKNFSNIKFKTSILEIEN